MSDTTTPPDERDKYETFLRTTRKRVRRDATDHDRALIGQGQTALLDRRDQLLDLKSRVNKAIRTRVERLDGEERALRQLSKEKKREELREAHVIVDSRQGGVILVRDAETKEVLAGPTPLSASQREAFAATKTQTNFLDDPVAANEELAKKLNLMEYLSDDPPATVHERVAAALEEGDLPDDLKNQLLDFLADDEADREEAGPAPKKTKKEKPAKEPKKRGRPKKSESTPAAPPPAPAASDEQPGPAVAEKDEALPKSPPKPKATLSEEPAEGERVPLVGEGDDETTLDGARQGLVESLASHVVEHDEEEGDEPEGTSGGEFLDAMDSAKREIEAGLADGTISHEEIEDLHREHTDPEPVDDGDLAAIPEPEIERDEEASEMPEPAEDEPPPGDIDGEAVPEESDHDAVMDAHAQREQPETVADDDDEIPDYESPSPAPAPEETSSATSEPALAPASDEPQPPAAETPAVVRGEPFTDATGRGAMTPAPEPAPADAPPAKKKSAKKEPPVAAAATQAAPPAPMLNEANHWGMPEMNAKQLVQASEATVKRVVFFSPILIQQIEAESKKEIKAETMRKAMPFVFRDLAAKGVFTARTLSNGDTAYYLIAANPNPKNLTADRVEATIAAYLKGERDPVKLKSTGVK